MGTTLGRTRSVMPEVLPSRERGCVSCPAGVVHLGPVGDVDHRHEMLVVIDAVPDALRAAPGGVLAASDGRSGLPTR